MTKTLTRTEISEALSNKIGLSKQRAGQVLSDILEVISQGMVEENYVKLSSFGSFKIRNKNDRIGRNPKTGQEVTITPRRTVSFRASHILKTRITK